MKNSSKEIPEKIYIIYIAGWSCDIYGEPSTPVGFYFDKDKAELAMIEFGIKHEEYLEKLYIEEEEINKIIFRD